VRAVKILYISNVRVPAPISRSLSVVRLCQALSDCGHDVTLLAYTNDAKAEDPIDYYGLRGGFTVISTVVPDWIHHRILAKLQITQLILGFLYRQHIQKIDPDLVYSRLTVWELIFVPADVPIIYEMHSLSLLKGNFCERWSLNHIVRRRKFKRLIVTTDRLREWLGEILPDHDIVVARLSAVEPRQLEQEELVAFRQARIEGSFDLNVGYTGFLDRSGYRGIDVLLKIADALPEVGVHVVGGLPEVVDYWKQRSLAKNIFFYGFQNPRDMPFYLSCLDIMLSPLQLEKASRAPTGKGMGLLKIPEYLSYGACIVASRLPAHEEVLTHNKNAILVAPDDIDEWVTAINMLGSDELTRNALKANAAHLYWEEMTGSKRVGKILSGV
jgi:glycosyltransferase involved in cell wall biosynthesis